MMVKEIGEMAKNPKMVMCRNCNTEIAANVKKCPACGAKNKKPFYKKWWFILFVIIVIIAVVGSLGGNDSKKEDKTVKYRWPSTEFVSRIPQPESEFGKISSESERYFNIDIYEVSFEQYEDYIDECKAEGFVVDYTKFDGYYSAKDDEGYSLMLSYDEDETEMNISLSAPVEEKEEQEVSDDKESVTSDESESTEAPVEEPSEETKEPEETKEKQDENLVDGMRPEFKEAMDSYEEFYKEYCDVLKKYSSNPTDLSILTEYTKLTEQSVEMSEKFEAWDEGEMNDAELKYYLEVSGRVTQMLLEVGQ